MENAHNAFNSLAVTVAAAVTHLFPLQNTHSLPVVLVEFIQFRIFAMHTHTRRKTVQINTSIINLFIKSIPFEKRYPIYVFHYFTH